MSGDRFKLGPFEAVRFHGYDEAGEWVPYMEKWGVHLGPLGSVWLHHFFRGDADRDTHDHPWPFWTFPLVSYVEEVRDDWPFPRTVLNVVRRFRLHARPASYSHRVIGPWEEGSAPGDWRSEHPEWVPETRAGGIWTIIFHRPKVRKWGFWKYRGGKWCWNEHHYYAHEGGKAAMCDDGDPVKHPKTQ